MNVNKDPDLEVEVTKSRPNLGCSLTSYTNSYILMYAFLSIIFQKIHL